MDQSLTCCQPSMAGSTASIFLTCSLIGDMVLHVFGTLGGTVTAANPTQWLTYSNLRVWEIAVVDFFFPESFARYLTLSK